MRPNSLAVLGLGAIGGSLAWRATLAGVPSVVGYAPDRPDTVHALKAQAVLDIADTPARAVRNAELVVLAGPPRAILDLLPLIAPHLAPGAIVTDVASIKLPILAAPRAAGLAARFAGGHPFAGTHVQGELGHEISKTKYDKEVPALREALLEAQYDLLQAKRAATLILIGGVDGAGKGETVNVLNEWLDPRHVHTHALGQPSDEELARPPYWRFWRSLPPRGKVGIFFGSWYTQPIIQRVFKQTSRAELDQAVDRIVHFERMLADENVTLVKIWFHLSKEQQKKRLEALSMSDKRTRWRVTERDWKHFELYDRFRKTSERVLPQTSTGHGPWHVVEGLDA